MGQWYIFLSQLSASLSRPIEGLAGQVNIPVASALLFGLLGSTAPCQLTTNLSAMAYVSRDLGNGNRGWASAAAYALGKVIVYSAFGGLVILFGRGLESAAIPVVLVARKVLGPLLILIGLSILGVITLKGSLGASASAWLKARIPERAVLGAFLMGIAFSFTFCPTLFWLFFGLTIPLGLRSSAGWSFPAIFALGTVIPLLGFTAVLSAGAEMGGAYLNRLKGMNRVVGRIAGAIFILAGLNDTLTYWAL